MKKILKGLSLFANVGIAETYFKEIGVSIILANEIDEKRALFYKELYPETKMIVGDITNDNIRQKLITESKLKKIDFIIATPPCQGMSLAGKMDPLDVRNQLIYYAVDVIKKVKPKFVLLENVPRQLKTKIKCDGELLIIPEYLKKELLQEYRFNEKNLIKAMDYGVPQMRERAIFLLVRKDNDILWEFPEPEKIVTLKEAIGDLPSLDPLLREGYEETIKLFPNYEKKKKEGLKISEWHIPPKHSKRHVEWLLRTPSGETSFNNKIYYPQKINGKKINGHNNTYRRLEWDKPCRTITQNNGVISSLTCVHPGRKENNYTDEKRRKFSDPRVLSIYELLIVSSLPKDWKIPKWATERMIRQVIGEGIPPLLTKKILINLIKKIKKG